MPIHGSYGHYAIDKTLTTSNDSGCYVFVYDTTRDSDGGAWRHRTQHTSWYNETLNTSIRGSRKEFPQVAVIQYDGTNLVIYDADDPNLPLWMKFYRNGGSSRDILYGCGSGGGQGGDLNGLRFHMLNGILVLCSTDTNFWPVLIDFIKDDCVGLQASNVDTSVMWWGGNLAERNTTSTNNNIYWSGDNRSSYMNGWWIRETLTNTTACNDVDMRVLPGAPINPSTGIEIPTIMFAKGDNDVGASSTTAGGVDIVLHSGEVIQKEATSNWCRFAKFVADDEIAVSRNAYSYFVTASIDEDSGQQHPSGWVVGGAGSGTGYAYFRENTGSHWPCQKIDDKYDLSNDSTYTNALVATKDAVAISNNYRHQLDGNGFTLYAAPQNLSAPYRRAAFIDRWGSSGWLYGKCMQAILCDSVDTSPNTGAITSPDILTNGTFASNITGWTDHSGSGSDIQWSASNGGRMNLNGAVAYARATQAITVVVGQAYTFIAEPDASIFGNAQELNLFVGTNNNGVSQDVGRAKWIKGTHDDAESIQVSFVAERTTYYVSIESGWNVAVLNAECRPASMDRSGYQDDSPATDIQDRARAIFWNGTLNFNPVGTGCELGAWSAFDGSSYFYQYWNTAHNGILTNSMYVMCWIKGNSGVLWHKSETGGLDCRCEFNGSNQIRFAMTNNGSISFYSDRVIEPDKWTHVVWVKNGARQGQLFLDGEFEKGESSSTDMTWNANNTSRFSIGNRADGQGNEAFNGSVTLFKMGIGAPSAQDIRQIYNDEKKLFVPGAKMSLGGDSGKVSAMDYDHSTGLLHVGTDQGTTAFEGIVRNSYDAGAVTRSISAAAGIVAKI